MTGLILDLTGVETFYDNSQALFGMSFSVRQGEFVTLLGRNGMGKSTAVKTIVGLVRPRRGSVNFLGQDIKHIPTYQIGQMGIGLVPEGRQLFGTLTVRENLVATAANRHHVEDPWTLEKIFELFPSLKLRERNLGSNLSGGEQQMVAIGRALMTNPKLLILDEATEGLAPLVRKEIWDCLGRLKSLGQTVIVIDKNIGPLLRLADMHHIVEKGRVIWSGTSEQLREQRLLLDAYLGI